MTVTLGSVDFFQIVYNVPDDKWRPLRDQVERHKATYAKVGAILRKAGDELKESGCIADEEGVQKFFGHIFLGARVEQSYYGELLGVLPDNAHDDFLDAVTETIDEALYGAMGVPKPV